MICKFQIDTSTACQILGGLSEQGRPVKTHAWLPLSELDVSGPKHDRKNDVKRDDGDQGEYEDNEDKDEDEEDKDEEGTEDGNSSEDLNDSSPEPDEPRRKPDFDLLKDMGIDEAGRLLMSWFRYTEFDIKNPGTRVVFERLLRKVPFDMRVCHDAVHHSNGDYNGARQWLHQMYGHTWKIFMCGRGS
ncbi:hypothetical protein BDR22DRAFT_817580 [Usnea florida]